MIMNNTVYLVLHVWSVAENNEEYEVLGVAKSFEKAMELKQKEIKEIREIWEDDSNEDDIWEESDDMYFYIGCKSNNDYDSVEIIETNLID